MDQRTEAARLNALRQLDLLDTPPSEAFDRITRMASQLFNLPIAVVSLTDCDRQWFKSRVGVAHTSIPRDKAPCAQVAEMAGPLVVPDLLLDARYRDSPLARSGVRFYAGASLTTRDGWSLGAMCVLGTEPRQVSPAEMTALTDLAAMVMSQIELQHAFGRIDPLSGLANRTQFIEDLEDLASDGQQERHRTVAVIDLASPEQLSSTARALGLIYVDSMVRKAALALGAALGQAAKAYHVAATQFAFLVPAAAEEADCVAAVIHVLGQAQDPGRAHYMTSMAAGLAPFGLGQTAPGDALRMAQSAAEEARRSRIKIGTFSLIQDNSHRRRFTLLDAFGAALEAPDQLRLVYQPRIDLASGRCVGAEALLRWTHPSIGAISPAEFIPIIEQTSLARSTTRWVLEAGLRQLARWRKARLELQLSINVSAANLLEPDFVEGVLQGLSRHSLVAQALELEITESAVMENAEQALLILDTLAKAGVRLAIDDFGTGYSSLSYLQRLPAHVVKIDQSFIREITADERKRALVSTMASLCHELNYRVVAEGVETAPVLACVREAGCDEVQGYFFGRPMDESRFAAWRRTRLAARETVRPDQLSAEMPRRDATFGLIGWCS